MSTLRRLADVAVAFPRSRELLSHDSWSREHLQQHQRTRLTELDVRLVPRIEDGRDTAGKLRIIEARL